MKSYSFAPIAAREYPTLHLLANPYIWGGVQFCVNLSEKPYSPELRSDLEYLGIEWVHCPVSEEPGADWLPSFAEALPKVYRAFKDGKKQIVHCDLGNNRSRALVEALYYAIHRKQFPDEYKGEINHLIYNCKEGHLPDVSELERRIQLMVGFIPNWSTPEESTMRQRILTPTTQITDSERYRRQAAALKNLLEFDYSGTLDLNRYYETGELPEDEAERKLFLELIEKGVI